MNEGYILEWLDDLITVTLNPVKNNIGPIHADDVAKLQKHIVNEKNKIMAAIKLFVFSMQNEMNKKSGIKLYHSSLIALLDQSIENQIHYVRYPELKQIYDELITCIDELILFIESRFSFYLGAYERLPATYFFHSKKELVGRISEISDNLSNYLEFQPASDILIHILLNYLNLQAEQHSFTFQDMAYIKDLCYELEQIGALDENGIFTLLDKRLIYMNFNHRTYVDNLIRRLAEDINIHDSAADRMERLLFVLKSFKQLHRKPGVIFNSKFQDLYSIINNWFRHEIFYLEKKMQLSARSRHTTAKLSGQKNPTGKTIPKVACSLSSDQIALFIRAAAELEILVGKSLNYLFKIIVPHISTPNRTNLSFDGVRSKSYVAEQRDKDIVIGILERIIKKIKEY